MSKIQIFVTHTPNKKSIRLENPLFYHVTAGSVFQKQPLEEGMLTDDTGEHISGKNKSYCELTTQYWAWKNIKADYYGFCHYRRYFSFAPQELPEADCGCLVFSYLDADTVKKLHLSEEAVKDCVKQYDFLIAKGIPAVAFQAKNVLQHYQNAKELHSKDIELMLAIIRENYPQMENAAITYLNGKRFYPCNMFIMKRELFDAYCTMLFTVLQDFEKRSDMSRYSREGYRTPGHLGERFLGIFYTYLSKQGKYRLGELQMAMIKHTSAQNRPSDLEVGLTGNVVPVVFAANENYIPVLFVCIQSLSDHADSSRNYHIYIFYTDISIESQKRFLQAFCRQGFQISFVDVSENAAGRCLKAKGHISSETYYRFFIADIMKEYPKVVYLDADLILCQDIAKLYDIDLENCYLAAVTEADVAGQYNGANPDTRRYMDETLHMKNPYSYFQAGVLVWNIKAWHEKVHTETLFRLAETGKYRYSDQDILNIVCEGHVKFLDMRWNVLADHMHFRYEHVIKYAPHQILDAYEEARRHPYIIHYAGEQKPWKAPDGDYAWEFWRTARRTLYYEVLLYGMERAQANRKPWGTITVDVLKRAAKKILPQGSWLRRAVGGLYWRMK